MRSWAPDSCIRTSRSLKPRLLHAGLLMGQKEGARTLDGFALLPVLETLDCRRPAWSAVSSIMGSVLLRPPSALTEFRMT